MSWPSPEPDALRGDEDDGCMSTILDIMESKVDNPVPQRLDKDRHRNPLRTHLDTPAVLDPHPDGP